MRRSLMSPISLDLYVGWQEADEEMVVDGHLVSVCLHARRQPS